MTQEERPPGIAPQDQTENRIDSPESRRKHVLDRLEAWVNEVLDEEDPPSGIAAEILSEIQAGEPKGSPTDLYSLWSAMISLTQEVKLQGRAFKRLEETIEPWIESAETITATHTEALSEARRFAELASTERRSQDDAIARTAEKRARGEMIAVLVDLRDRLKRGAESAGTHIVEAEKAARTSWLGRLRGRRGRAAAGLDSVRAIFKGYLLSLERLEEALGEIGLHEIDCKGELFDPRLMRAVDIEETTMAVDGQVLEVYRSGFLWDGEIYRPAEVKVARAKRTPSDKEA
jgi:molecular chaperone GrpE